MATGVCDSGANSDNLQAKPSTVRTNCWVHGGYRCIFVKDPPDHLQTECSICLGVLREPYLVDCCGYSFCRSCIEPIKSEHQPCPLCAVQFTTCIPDKRLQRTLNDLEVYCSHKEGGCEWVGQMRDLPQHLNVDAVSEGDRLFGCPLVSLKCTYCDESIQRQHLKEHEYDYCGQRPYSCDMCQCYNSTHEDVIHNHQPVCPCRPMACPNNCGEIPSFEQLGDHLRDCPLQVIDCAFSYAGCSERLPREDMPDHIAKSIISHVSLQGAKNEQEIRKLNERIEELETLYEQSRAEVAGLQKANQLLVKQLEQKHKEAKDEVKQEIAVFSKDVREHLGLVPYTFIMPNFEQNKQENTKWYSPSFYTHPRGYKMCVRITANGTDFGKDHVSIFVVMMKGEHDVYLRWPFRGEVTIKLLSQEGDKNKTKTMHFHDNSHDDVAGRVIKGEQADRGLGYHQFINHRDLQPDYLMNDCLQLCVENVKITAA